MPGPRAPARRARLALSKLALKQTGMPSFTASDARASAVRGTTSPSSATQGPAMRNGDSRKLQPLTMRRLPRADGLPGALLVAALEGGAHEAGEQRVRTVRAAT